MLGARVASGLIRDGPAISERPRRAPLPGGTRRFMVRRRILKRVLNGRGGAMVKGKADLIDEQGNLVATFHETCHDYGVTAPTVRTPCALGAVYAARHGTPCALCARYRSLGPFCRGERSCRDRGSGIPREERDRLLIQRNGGRAGQKPGRGPRHAAHRSCERYDELTALVFGPGRSEGVTKGLSGRGPKPFT